MHILCTRFETGPFATTKGEDFKLQFQKPRILTEFKRTSDIVLFRGIFTDQVGDVVLERDPWCDLSFRPMLLLNYNPVVDRIVEFELEINFNNNEMLELKGDDELKEKVRGVCKSFYASCERATNLNDNEAEAATSP